MKRLKKGLDHSLVKNVITNENLDVNDDIDEMPYQLDPEVIAGKKELKIEFLSVEDGKIYFKEEQ